MYLALENGDTFQGSCEYPTDAAGELVFTTAQHGYEESITDPSYYGQGICFAYPHIGNYGINYERFESNEVQPNLIVTRDATSDFTEFCSFDDVPVVDSIDTRNLVLSLREEGSMKCGVSEDRDTAMELAHNYQWEDDYPNRVSRDETDIIEGDGPRIAIVDCGIKKSIIEAFEDRDCELYIYPQESAISEVKWCKPDMLFLSNGPGNPADYEYPEHLVSFYFQKIPITGICLGQQIIARALNGETKKMRFGHRGVNQPVKTPDGTVITTTQNHSYEVTDTGVLTVTHTNVNDGSPEGLLNPHYGVVTRQYHPEGNPGPSDMSFFDTVVDMATRFQNEKDLSTGYVGQ